MPLRKTVKTRSRSGCLRCRTRRRKCDGTHPRCKNCESKGFTCQWGLKVSFHRSRNFSLSQGEAAALTAIEGRRQSPRSGRIVDQTDEVIRHFTEDAALQSDEQEGTSHDDVTVFHDEDIQTSILSQELEDSINPIFSPLLPPYFDAPTPSNLPFSLGQAVSKNVSPHPVPSLPVTDAEKARLIASYLQETGTWCETTDSDRQFTVQSVRNMMDSPAFAAAAMSLASRQLDNIDRRQRPVTLELYQYIIQLLIRQDPAAADASVLATCTLLCVYEMMASSVSEWRRHLQGCAGLLRAKRWNGSSAGIVKSCFWAFARMDVWAAFNSGKTTLIPTEFWVDDKSIESVAATENIDDYCNLAILIFAEIVNVLATDRRYDKTTRLMLWNQLQEWYQMRPKEAHPLLQSLPTASNPFPMVVFTTSSAICGNTFYHAGSILLLQTGLPTDTEQDDPIWHARELAGMSISNTSHANWVNQLQPLYIAGTIFAGITASTQSPTPYAWPLSNEGNERNTSIVEEEFAAEKFLLLKHLSRIERETGWKTSDRAGDLRRLWGIE